MDLIVKSIACAAISSDSVSWIKKKKKLNSSLKFNLCIIGSTMAHPQAQTLKLDAL